MVATKLQKPSCLLGVSIYVFQIQQAVSFAKPQGGLFVHDVFSPLFHWMLGSTVFHDPKIRSETASKPSKSSPLPSVSVFKTISSQNPLHFQKHEELQYSHHHPPNTCLEKKGIYNLWSHFITNFCCLSKAPPPHPHHLLG